MARFDSDLSLFILRGRSSSRAVWEAASPSWRGTVSTCSLFHSACFRKGFYMWHPEHKTASVTPIYTGTNVSINILLYVCKLLAINQLICSFFPRVFQNKYDCSPTCCDRSKVNACSFLHMDRSGSSAGLVHWLFFDRISRLSVRLCMQRWFCSRGRNAARDSTINKYAEVYCV